MHNSTRRSLHDTTKTAATKQLYACICWQYQQFGMYSKCKTESPSATKSDMQHPLISQALFHGICPARFTSSLKLLFSPGPGLGAPPSNYLEVALYKFHRQIDT